MKETELIRLLPEVLPAYDDAIFKSHLTQNGAELALSELASDLTGRKITSLTINKNNAGKRHITAKVPEFDISCSDAVDINGTQLNIEMSAHHITGDNLKNEHENQRHRAVFNVSALHSGQDARGKEYTDLRHTYQITITNFSMYSPNRKFYDRYSYKNNDGKELSDQTTIIFLDLTFVKEILKKDIEQMTAIEKWAVYISKANDPKFQNIIGKIAEQKEGIAVALTALKKISMSEEQRLSYISRMIAENDYGHKKAVEKRQAEEKKKLALENKELVAEKKKLTSDNKKLTSETKKLTSETKKLTSETKKLTAENQKLAEKLNKINAENHVKIAELGSELSEKDTALAEYEHRFGKLM